MTSSELIENGNMNEQWPLLAILCVLIGFTVYSWAQRQKIDGFRMLLRENKSEINRKEVHDAVECEIENQTMSSRGWEEQVWKLEDAVGTTRKNLSDNVEGIAANVVALYFLIELRISVVLEFFCSTNVLPIYNEVCKHPNPKE